MIEHKSLIVEFYNSGFRQLTNNPNFTLDLEMQNQEKVLSNFLLLLEKNYTLSSIGFEFLLDYFDFQFYYWQDKDIKRNPSLSWLIGPAALDRFKNIKKQEEVRYYIKEQSKISFLDLIHKYKFNSSIDIAETPVEKVEKERFLNTERGLRHCIEYTSLFSYSMTCLKCTYKKSCKLLLKKNYPQLYLARNVK